MKVTTGKASVTEAEIASFSPLEVKRRVARAEGSSVPPATEPERAQSAARKRLEKLKAMAGPEVEYRDVDGERIGFARLSQSGIAELALSMQRDGHSILNISDKAAATSAAVAILNHCVVGEDGEAYFSDDPDGATALEYIESYAATAAGGELLMYCYERNPDLLGTLKKT